MLAIKNLNIWRFDGFDVIFWSWWF